MLSDRPIIKLDHTRIDRIIDCLVVAGIIVLWAYTFISYSGLPQTIPIHYNVHGKIDGYGSRATIWILPVLVTFIIMGMQYLNKHPWLFNYTAKITEENAVHQYTLATRLLRVMQLIIVLLFLFINVDIILSAKTGQSFFSKWMIPLFMAIMIIPTIVVIILSKKKG